ncbi:amine oxidase catalytic domain-containing protein, partial [Cristinia sonorae]
DSLALPDRASRFHGSRRNALIALLVTGFIAASLVVFPSSHSLISADFEGTLQEDGSRSLEQCPANIPPKATPPAPVNVWASLSITETVAVTEWLSSEDRDLNLTRADEGGLSDNLIFLVEAYRPSKSAALAYLDAPSDDTLPPRFARVTVHHGAAPEPYIQDYLVGPLPISERTTWSNLTDIYHRDPIPFHARGYTGGPFVEMEPLFQQILTPLRSVVKDLFGSHTFEAGVTGPFSFDGSFRRGWVNWRRSGSGNWLQPIGFYQYVDVSGNDPSKWKVLKVVYNYQVFQSIDEFLKAYNSGTLKRQKQQVNDQMDNTWTTRARLGAQRDLDHLPGPRSVSFAGLRFRVDRATQYVSWMGWGLYLGFDRDMGMSLWDVRFRGERIIYELSPQEAIAQYSGNDPAQSTTAWLDRYFGMGGFVHDLLPGYDCPHEAVFLPATTHSSHGSIRRKRAICIFEKETGRPITRHLGYKDGESGAVKGYLLTVRTVSTVGNYDYIFDYMFYLDGTMEVRVSASGYLQGAYWEAEQEGYGTRIHELAMGSLHDHVINFKVDLDIAGSDNSLVYTSTAQEQVEQPWFDDDWGQTVIQQKISREVIPNENDAMLQFPANLQGIYSIVNQAKTNSWGLPRGYSIHPGDSPIRNTVVGSKRLLNNANWARYNMAVSKRKDTEPSSSSMWNFNLPGAPMVDFHKFFDGENITQEDLVAWVNVGMHHLTQSEDAPNTRTQLATSSFYLAPANYFDSDVSMESTNAIVITASKDPSRVYDFEEYGVKQANCVPPVVPPFEYGDMQVMGLDGKPVTGSRPATVDELMRSENVFRYIKVEL